MADNLKSSGQKWTENNLSKNIYEECEVEARNESCSSKSIEIERKMRHLLTFLSLVLTVTELNCYNTQFVKLKSSYVKKILTRTDQGQRNSSSKGLWSTTRLLRSL